MKHRSLLGRKRKVPSGFSRVPCPGGLGSERSLTSESESDELELEELEDTEEEPLSLRESPPPEPLE